MAATGTIRIPLEEMRARANEVRGHGENYDQIISAMGNLINALLTEWEGLASQSFDRQFYELRPSFNAMSELFIGMTNQLNGTADRMERLDIDIGGNIGVQ